MRAPFGDHSGGCIPSKNRVNFRIAVPSGFTTASSCLFVTTTSRPGLDVVPRVASDEEASGTAIINVAATAAVLRSGLGPVMAQVCARFGSSFKFSTYVVQTSVVRGKSHPREFRAYSRRAGGPNRPTGRPRRSARGVAATDTFRRRDVANVDNRRWSLYGAQRLQPVAIGGKCDAPQNGSDKRKPLPWVATSCLSRSMVSSRGGAGGRHRGGVRMPAPDRSTPASPWCCEPVGKYGAGACGAVDCCLEREPQSRTWRPLRSGASCRLERRHMMDVVVERCAGLDVHRDSVVATVRLPGNGKSRRRREQQTRSFGSTIGQLETLADWLEGFGVTLVGMEATGVYWKPVFYVLERRFECWLLNAQHLHNVPGRKSD